ncbi:hypothetical protein NC652_019052 [Populus alba x Populus x berolinensis]|nr:hypothetical protein NC652_019052 [Populus alba x Populus x berolinensis]
MTGNKIFSHPTNSELSLHWSDSNTQRDSVLVPCIKKHSVRLPKQTVGTSEGPDMKPCSSSIQLSYFKESLIIAERFLGVHIYSGLMIKDNMKDGERVLYEIANAAQKMSNAAWDNTGSVSFFVEILSKYLYFFEKGNPQITGTAIQSLIELITPEMQSDNSTPDPAADAFLSRTLGYIQFQKQKGGANGEKYDPIKV